MIQPAHIVRSSYFSPLNSTPAVCLTQSLPPEQLARILLLGCGDARGILYTAYAGAGTNHRKMDITCCDKEAEIVARNIMLLTLIMEDTSGANIDLIWSIYHDPKVNPNALHLLREHVRLLLNLAASLGDWEASQIGKLIRFTDAGSLVSVRKVWRFYSLMPSDGQGYLTQQGKLVKGADAAKTTKEEVMNHITPVSSFRAFAPLSLAAGYDIFLMYKHFWEHQTTDINDCDKNAKQLNPMFGTLRDSLVMYYGTEPLAGYHLSTAHAHLAADSYLKPTTKEEGLARLLTLAKLQFRTWAEAFRKIQPRLTIRFVVADALAFCHVLQHRQTHKALSAAHWYRNNWDFDHLRLDSRDYTHVGAHQAPFVFDVIETSSLVDQLGCLNILVATAPLLSSTPSSTISSMVAGLLEERRGRYGSDLLLGDLGSVSLILGLSPTQYWNTATAISSSDEEFFADISSQGKNSSGSQSLSIVTWKKIVASEVSNKRGGIRRHEVFMDPNILAQLIYDVFTSMFKANESTSPSHNTGIAAPRDFKHNHELYSRASFAALLRIIKTSGITIWADFIKYLDALMQSPVLLTATTAAREYIPGSSLQSQVLELFTYESFSIFEKPFTERYNLILTPLKDWLDIPSVVYLTIQVPRENLLPFQNALVTDDQHACEMSISHPLGQNSFSGLQLGFGRLAYRGKRYTSDYAVGVQRDESMWEGTTPLIVSAIIPTRVFSLPRDFASAKVCFSLKKTSTSKSYYANVLGPDLRIYSCGLSYTGAFITRFPPNQIGLASVASGRPCLDAPQVSPSVESDSFGIASTSVMLAHGANVPEHLITGVQILSPEIQQMTLNSVNVRMVQQSPYELALQVGDLRSDCITMPMPISTDSEISVGPEAGVIRFKAAVLAPSVCSIGAWVQFESIITNIPHLRCLHYLNLDVLPRLHLSHRMKMDWLEQHLATMYSNQDHEVRIMPHAARQDALNTLVSFKQTLQNWLLNYAGRKPHSRHTVFRLIRRQGSPYVAEMLIYCAGLRLDVSNQAVVLDAVVITVTDENASKVQELVSRSGATGTISIDHEEVLMWKYAIPAFAERCRNWEHSELCEYKIDRLMPLSTILGEEIMCSCGIGQFSQDSTIEKKAVWDEVSKLAVRVAISPSFPVAFVERLRES